MKKLLPWSAELELNTKAAAQLGSYLIYKTEIYHISSYFSSRQPRPGYNSHFEVAAIFYYCHDKLNHFHIKTSNTEQMREGRHDVFFKFIWGNTPELTSPSLKNQYDLLSSFTAIRLPGDLPGIGDISKVGLGSSAASWYPLPITDTRHR